MKAGRDIGRGVRRDPDPDTTYLQPGEYGRHPHDGHWYARVPHDFPDGDSIFANLSNHDITEHEDGTITVSPSILVTAGRNSKTGNERRWHGYLHEGVWYED